MEKTCVSVQRRRNVAVVQFVRGKNLNAFNDQVIADLTDSAHELSQDATIRAIVLTGDTNVFSSGIDLKEARMFHLDGLNDVERREVLRAGVRLCAAWESLPQVTVCAMEGMSVGAGMAIALACDWRVLADDAYLYMPEIRIGLNLQWGALPRLVALVGPARAKRAVLLAERLRAQEALTWGLVDELAERGGALDRALILAEQVAEMPPVAVRMVKEAINACSGALQRATSFADADQSYLCTLLDTAKAERTRFGDPKASAVKPTETR